MDTKNLNSDEIQEMLQFLNGKSLPSMDKEMGERAFRWGLVFQIKEMLAEMGRLRTVLQEIQSSVRLTEELRVKFGAIEHGLQELEKKVGSENLHDIKDSVDTLKEQFDDIKNQLLRSDLGEMGKKIASIQDWIHERELLLSAERLRELITNVNSNSTFQIKVMAVIAAALSGFTLLATIFKIFGGN